MSIDHAKAMEAAGTTISGYIRSETFQMLRELFSIPANDDTDNGRFVLLDGTSRVFVAQFTDLVEDNAYLCRYGFESQVPIEAGLHKSRAGIGFQAFLEHIKETTLNLLDPTRIQEVGESADTASTDGAGDDLGKQDTNASGDSTSAPAAVDPAESASEVTDNAEEVTASTETKSKKSKKSADAESAE